MPQGFPPDCNGPLVQGLGLGVNALNLVKKGEGDNAERKVGVARYQMPILSVGGEYVSTSLTGWLPINADHRAVSFQIDMAPDTTQIVGGDFYLMGYRD